MTVIDNIDISRDDVGLATELESVVESNLNRHLGVAKEWFPYQYTPWSQGTDFEGPLGGTPWAAEQSRLSAPARAALVVAVLSEDNLPSYFHIMLKTYSDKGAWREWIHRWSAEENRHSIVLRDYLHTTRAVDPVALERARMQQLSVGYENDYGTVLHTIAYTAVLEWVNRIVHRNTGIISGDDLCDQMMARLSMDENLHMVFFRNLLEAGFEIDADAAMVAVADIMTDFRMPGHEIGGFSALGKDLAAAGVYNARIHHDTIVAPFLRHLHILDRTDLGSAGRAAQDRVGRYFRRMEFIAQRFHADAVTAP